MDVQTVQFTLRPFSIQSPLKEFAEESVIAIPRALTVNAVGKQPSPLEAYQHAVAIRYPSESFGQLWGDLAKDGCGLKEVTSPFVLLVEDFLREEREQV
jgi:hypothetical protein